jgi:hypothetical protein
MRAKKLMAIFKECVKRNLIPEASTDQPKLHWRRFKRQYKLGELDTIFPSM